HSILPATDIINRRGLMRAAWKARILSGVIRAMLSAVPRWSSPSGAGQKRRRISTITLARGSSSSACRSCSASDLTESSSSAGRLRGRDADAARRTQEVAGSRAQVVYRFKREGGVVGKGMMLYLWGRGWLPSRGNGTIGGPSPVRGRGYVALTRPLRGLGSPI